MGIDRQRDRPLRRGLRLYRPGRHPLPALQDHHHRPDHRGAGLGRRCARHARDWVRGRGGLRGLRDPRHAQRRRARNRRPRTSSAKRPACQSCAPASCSPACPAWSARRAPCSTRACCPSRRTFIAAVHPRVPRTRHPRRDPDRALGLQPDGDCQYSAEHAVETLLSGPAASALGGSALTGQRQRGRRRHRRHDDRRGAHRARRAPARRRRHPRGASGRPWSRDCFPPRSRSAATAPSAGTRTARSPSARTASSRCACSPNSIPAILPVLRSAGARGARPHPAAARVPHPRPRGLAPPPDRGDRPPPVPRAGKRAAQPAAGRGCGRRGQVPAAHRPAGKGGRHPARRTDPDRRHARARRLSRATTARPPGSRYHLRRGLPAHAARGILRRASTTRFRARCSTAFPALLLEHSLPLLPPPRAGRRACSELLRLQWENRHAGGDSLLHYAFRAPAALVGIGGPVHLFLPEAAKALGADSASSRTARPRPTRSAR